MKLINKAKEYIKEFHREHVRSSGESYIDHLEQTVENLKENNIEDELLITAAYLKNVLLIDSTKEVELKNTFGSNIVELLQRYKYVSQSAFQDLEDKNINDLVVIQAYLELMDDYRVLLLRLATKVADSQTLLKLPRKEALKIAQKLLNIYSPIARLVSMRSFAIKLENNAFKILHPEVYVKIEKRINILEDVSEEFLTSTIPTLVDLLKEQNIRVHDITARIKHIYGVFRKENYYKYKGIYVGKNYEGIKDILGLRIIVETIDQCYKTEDMLKQLWEFIPEERDDYIQRPRVSGYKALHNVFRTEGITFETQILTKDMYTFNEFGHSVYKILDKDKIESRNERIKNYLDNYLKSIEKINLEKPLIKTNNKIYVFTPKGDIVELPKEATIIDFAYSIHADIGNNAVGAIVNGVNKKLTDTLKHGDKVEIKTLSSKKYPGKDWIKVVKTAKARTLIRKALRAKK